MSEKYRISYYEDELFMGRFTSIEHSTKWMTMEELELVWDKYRLKAGRVVKQPDYEEVGNGGVHKTHNKTCRIIAAAIRKETPRTVNMIIN